VHKINIRGKQIDIACTPHLKNPSLELDITYDYYEVKPRL
jgi:hypothetical protein